MKKLFTVLSLLIAGGASAQTLFYYGNDSVSVPTFLKAYGKNNNGPRTEKAVRDYLHLYISSRLKIREAKARGYDTLPQLVADMNNLRQQILPSYLNDKDAVDRLSNEAFERAQKELHLAHIFIGPVNGNEASWKQKAAEAEQALKSGRSFEEVAKAFSSDPSVSSNGGDLGWITVFSLPYELENLAYQTPVGKTSPVFQSPAGFHIFKNLGERKPRGRVKASQILLAFPPDATADTKEVLRKRADSIYNRLLKGDDFGKLATLFSNDVISAAANGQMQEFGTGQYDAQFEDAVFALSKDGAIAKPFLTAYGYHIVKRNSLEPVPSKKTEAVLQEIGARLEGGDRLQRSRQQWIESQVKNVPFSEPAFSSAVLQSYTDSVLDAKKPQQPLTLKGSDALFRIGSKTITLDDWTSYARTFRYQPDGSGVKPFPVVYKEFVETLRVDYYQNHLEDFSPQFAEQLNEFLDGNLFFEIMQRDIWGPAQTDSIALQDFYNRNKSRYAWKESADAVVFYVTDAAAAKTFRDLLVKQPSKWSALVEQYNEKVAADSSRFELQQLPNGSKGALTAGMVTAPQQNALDGSISFAWVIRKHAAGAPRSFAQARGMVVNDYQAELEAKWMKALKEKYPVRINEASLRHLK